MSNDLEYCFSCGEPTGRAGEAEDSLYNDQGEGPYCEGCWDAHENELAQQKHLEAIARQEAWSKLTDAERWTRIHNVF